jgi:hypothetical protein
MAWIAGWAVRGLPSPYLLRNAREDGCHMAHDNT